MTAVNPCLHVAIRVAVMARGAGPDVGRRISSIRDMAELFALAAMSVSLPLSVVLMLILEPELAEYLFHRELEPVIVRIDCVITSKRQCTVQGLEQHCGK